MIDRSLLKPFIFISILISSVFFQSAHASTYSKTKYPIVMVHGAFGFDSILGVVDYWYYITNNMRRRGAEVYVVNMSSAAHHEIRGEELREDIQEILAISGAPKVNLIAHSQGATAARYVAAVEPDWIASVSCAHCMNQGTQFADGFSDLLNAIGVGSHIVDGGVSMLLNLLELISSVGSDGGYNSDINVDQSMIALAEAASFASYDEFNNNYPQAMPKYDCSVVNEGRDGPGSTLYKASGAHNVNGIRYYSWGGNRPITNRIDPFDSIVIPIINLFMGGKLKWDGFIPTCGMALGKALRMTYRANHFDAINHALALTAWGVNVPSIYYTHANRLKRAGL